METVKKIFAKVSHKWVAWAFTAILATIMAWFAGKSPEIPPVPDDPLFLGKGWVDDQREVKFVLQDMEFQTFGQTPAGRAVRGLEPKEVFLWKAWERVNGRPLPARNQGGVGSCVSFGTASAIEVLLAVQIAGGENQDYHDLAQEVIYGGSRVEIGGGRISGDGSVGAWAADFVKKYGVLARGKHGKYDLTVYNEATCRDFGRRGVPNELEPECRKNPVGDAVLVTTVEEARKALAQGYPIAVCSNQGFTSTRDKDGFATQRGTWAHCQAILGYRSDRRGFWIQNSWGPNWIQGPKGLGEGPDGGYWAEEKVVARMLAQSDSWAFSGVKGFPAKEIDFRIFAPAVRPARELFAKRFDGVFALAP